jgi:hypothetical protein
MLGAGQSASATPYYTQQAQDEVMRNNNMTDATSRYDTDVDARTSLANNRSDNETAWRNYVQQSADRRLDIATDADTSRYDTNIDAETSRFTNAADNTRALATNTADNNRALYEFNQTPYNALDANGNPIITTQGQAPGMQPILSNTDRQGTLANTHFGNMGALPPQEQAYLGANAGGDKATPDVLFRQYYDLAIGNGYDDVKAREWAMSQAAKRGDGMSITTPDGMEIVVGGTNLGELTGPMRGQMQSQELAFRELQAAAQQARDISRNPTDFGVTGNVRYGLQQLGQIGKNVGMLDRKTYQVMSEVEDPGVLAIIKDELNEPDPNMRALRSLRVQLAYAAAKANGSTGRSLSDQEFKTQLEVIGDPTAWMTTQDSFLAALATVEYNASANRLSRVNEIPPLSLSQYLPMYIKAAKTGGAIPSLEPKNAQNTQNNAALGGQAPPSPDAATPQASSESPQGGVAPVQKWGRGPDGMPLRLQ